MSIADFLQPALPALCASSWKPLALKGSTPSLHLTHFFTLLLYIPDASATLLIWQLTKGYKTTECCT